jgi:hypothetical protein
MIVAMIGTRARHRGEAGPDGLALPALLGADPGVGPRRVDEREDGEAELVRQLVHAAGLPVPLRVRLAEVSRHLLLGAAPLLVADDDHAAPAVGREAAHDRGVLGEAAVAVELLEIGEEVLDVIEGVRPVGVTRELHLLPRGEVREELAREAPRLLLQPLQLPLEAAVALGEDAQLPDAIHELDDGLLERQNVCGHGRRAP